MFCSLFEVFQIEGHFEELCVDAGAVSGVPTQGILLMFNFYCFVQVVVFWLDLYFQHTSFK